MKISGAMLTVFLLLGVRAGAQIPQFSSPALPEVDGSWTIVITTSGGFTGQGRGSAFVTSTGARSCLLPTGMCSPLLSEEKLAPLKQFATSFDSSAWLSPAAASMSICSDCYITTATLTRREIGLAKSYSFTWSIANANSVPADLVRIAELSLSGKW